LNRLQKNISGTTNSSRIRSSLFAGKESEEFFENSIINDKNKNGIVVKVLGPVEIVGIDKPFGRPWALELIVYLALHPQGVPNDIWSAALWPDRRMAQATLHSTASSARKALGCNSLGQEYLPKSHGSLALSTEVTSDWAYFTELIKSEQSANDYSALRLIRGRPFLGLRSFDWVVMEGFVAQIEEMVVEVACRLAEKYLSEGNGPGAMWSARQALLVSPYDERLYRLLMRAADRMGHPEGVEAAMRELLREEDLDTDIRQLVHPETLTLYEQLAKRHRFYTISND